MSLFSIRIGSVVRVLSLASFAVLAIGGMAALRPDLVVVERVEIAGNAEATAPAVRHLADVRNGTRLWEVDTDRVARSVERHPWIARATVSRVWPTTLRIEVEEHRPAALLHLDRLHYVSEDGVIFTSADPDDLGYPSLTGIEPSLEASHPDLPRLVVRDALSLVTALDARGLVDRSAVHEVHFDRQRGFTVMAGRSRLAFGLSERDTQLDRLASLISHGRVDLTRPLSVDLAPARVAIVRPLPAGAEG